MRPSQACANSHPYSFNHLHPAPTSHPGPRSLEGKRRSSFNALKHGACSDQVVLPYERRADYDQFHQDLLDDYQPQSVLEELMLERLATAQWLSRRVVGCMQDAFDVAARENSTPATVSYPILMKMTNQNDRTADRCTEMLLKIQRDRAKEHREFLKAQDLSETGFVPPKNEESAPPYAETGLHVVQNDPHRALVTLKHAPKICQKAPGFSPSAAAHTLTTRKAFAIWSI